MKSKISTRMKSKIKNPNFKNELDQILEDTRLFKTNVRDSPRTITKVFLHTKNYESSSVVRGSLLRVSRKPGFFEVSSLNSWSEFPMYKIIKISKHDPNQFGFATEDYEIEVLID